MPPVYAKAGPGAKARRESRADLPASRASRRPAASTSDRIFRRGWGVRYLVGSALWMLLQ